MWASPTGVIPFCLIICFLCVKAKVIVSTQSFRDTSQKTGFHPGFLGPNVLAALALVLFELLRVGESRSADRGAVRQSRPMFLNVSALSWHRAALTSWATVTQG